MKLLGVKRTFEVALELSDLEWSWLRLCLEARASILAGSGDAKQQDEAEFFARLAKELHGKSGMEALEEMVLAKQIGSRYPGRTG